MAAGEISSYKMKRIGVVSFPSNSGHRGRGVGFYTKNLINSLELQAKNHDMEIIELEGSQDSSSFAKCDLVHYPFFDLFWHTLPIIKNNPTVVTIHDVIPLEFPEHYKLGARGWYNLQLQKLAIKTANMVITDSMASLGAIRKYLKVPHHKLKVIYLAANRLSSPKDKSEHKLPKKFVLYVGGINYNKNLPNLILACKKINIPLVIVGKEAAQIENLDLDHAELVHLKNIDWSNVIRLGFVEDLEQIYKKATVYCQPSYAEGFGLPILEALECGTAVACSNAHSLPEVGGEVVEYFNPYDIDDMARAISSAKKKNYHDQLAKFSWDKTAKETIMVYEEVLNTR